MGSNFFEKVNFMKPANHILHRYQRSKANKNVYRCLHPDCSHYARKPLLEGKRAECGKCGEDFILTNKQLNNFNPVCDFCSKAKKSKVLKLGVNIMEQILNKEKEEEKEIGL